MGDSQIKAVSATGDITTADAYLKAVSITAAADAASVTVKSGGSGGTTVLVVKAAIGATAVVPNLHDAYCADGIHVTLSGTGPSATVVFE